MSYDHALSTWLDKTVCYAIRVETSTAANNAPISKMSNFLEQRLMLKEKGVGGLERQNQAFGMRDRGRYRIGQDGTRILAYYQSS